MAETCCEKTMEYFVERMEKLLKTKSNQHTSDRNIQISLALMAMKYAESNKRLKWGDKVNCKAVADNVRSELEMLCHFNDMPSSSLSNLEKDISSGLKIIEEMVGVKVNE